MTDPGYLVSGLLVLAALLVTCTTHADTISYAQLNQRTKILGSLGRPLGQLIRIEGVAVADSHRRAKADVGKTLLQVETVDGKKLNKAVIVVMHSFAFAPIEKPDPGKRFEYAGYETGGMTGIPAEAFQLMPVATTTAYHFEVYFQACKDLSKNPGK